MKKGIIIIGIAMLFFVACGKKEPAHYGVDAKTVFYANLEEMEESCDLIVRGVRLSGDESNINTVNGNVASAYTFSKFEIIDIFKDSSNELENGNTITILENEAYNKEENVVYHIAGYNMMVVGNEYLLFLNKHNLNGTEYYYSCGVNFGTVSLQEDNRNVDRFTQNGASVTDFSYFEDIWNSAKEKYIK